MRLARWLDPNAGLASLDASGRAAVERAVEPLWHGVAAFRWLALAYVVIAYSFLDEYFDRPLWGWFVVGLMVVWTVLVTLAYRTPIGRRPLMVVTDVAVACLAIAATPLVDDPHRVSGGEPTLALVWPAAAVLAAAARWGLPGGLCAACVTSAASLAARGEFSWTTVRNVVLLMVTGVVVGYAAGLFRSSQAVLVQALRVEAAVRERDRLARSVHDGVLQALAMVQRQAAALGGDGPALARLAGEQEVALRTLVSTRVSDSAGGIADLSGLLAALTTSSVSLSRPSTAVEVDARVARELVAAVRAAIDNAERHAGAAAHVWILLEDELDQITVTVRDDGVGFDPERLPEAAAEGRMGVSESIVGRARDLGGSVTVISQPGSGTEIEIRVPRRN